jgi:hypothetical protein
MRKACTLLFFILFSYAAIAQELFPVAENASNIPKGALGIRLLDEGYKESDLYRNLAGLKLLYGITPRLSIYATATVSDIHEKTLPFDFITHNHSGGQTTSSTNTPQEGIPYPYVFNSIDIYAKYRFYSADGVNSHFRMAAYAEGSRVIVPSHEAEPDLLMHTSGYGAGIIATYLKRHFATSITTGFIIPAEYQGNTYDEYSGVYPTTIQYGKAINYSLSFGYLLFPKNYKSYKQTNWNIYCEFTGKAYGAAKAYQYDGPFAGALLYTLPITTPILKAGKYLDIDPGIQCILNSTYRIDLSLAFPLVNESYDHLYPFYLIGIQRYFYFRHHASEKSDKLQ